MEAQTRENLHCLASVREGGFCKCSVGHAGRFLLLWTLCAATDEATTLHRGLYKYMRYRLGSTSWKQ